MGGRWYAKKVMNSLASEAARVGPQIHEMVGDKRCYDSVSDR